MKETCLRAAACALFVSTLVGCAPLHLTQFGAAVLATALTGEALSAVQRMQAYAPTRSDRRRHGRRASASLPYHSYPDDEMRGAGITCEGKLAEWVSVYGARRPPPQLRCGPNGEFGSPRVYGSEPLRTAAAPAEQTLARKDP